MRVYSVLIFNEKDHCVARIALPWNGNVSSAYRIAFAGERKRDGKQRDFAPKNAIHLFKTHHFPKWNKHNQIPARIWGGRDLRRISTRIKCHHSRNVWYFDPNKFQKYFI